MTAKTPTNAIKTILITGATAGIGRHAALAFVREGHHVIATGRRESALATLKGEASKLSATAKSDAGAGAGAGRLDILALDVTDNASVAAAVLQVDALTAGRGLDVLVNNAGYGQMGPVEEISDAELRRQYDTNVFGLMAVTRAFLPKMRERGVGRIVNVGSLGGRYTFPLMGVYNSTKYAVESLSDALRNELAPFGIDVSIIEPGPISTEFNDRAMDTLDVAAYAGSAYAPVIEQADRFRKRFEASSAGPEVTTRAIMHASLARRPRVRYVVPRRIAFLLALLAILPTRLIDYVMQRASGLTRKNLEQGSRQKPPRIAAAS
jgi:NAD(P)-dependent dehydrogenase (short-subunit alcohol dehydrogenase family)